jgi:hypothetical protein
MLMARIRTEAKHRLSAALAAGVILAAAVAVTAFPGSAVAEDHHGGGDHRGGDHHGGGDHRGGGYYGAPPVVYGAPYYAAPPVVFGAPFGLNINIR